MYELTWDPEIVEKKRSNKLAYNQDLIQLQRTLVVKVELNC